MKVRRQTVGAVENCVLKPDLQKHGWHRKTLVLIDVSKNTAKPVPCVRDLLREHVVDPIDIRIDEALDSTE